MRGMSGRGLADTSAGRGLRVLDVAAVGGGGDPVVEVDGWGGVNRVRAAAAAAAAAASSSSWRMGWSRLVDEHLVRREAG